MGGVLSNGFNTLVREILIERDEKKTVPEFEDMRIGSFKDFIQQFAANSDVKNEEDLASLISSSSSYTNNIWSKLTNVTNGKVLSFCKLIIESFVQIAAPLRKRRQHLFVQDIQDALNTICNEPGCTPFLQNFFQKLIKWTEEEIVKLSVGSALNNFISGAAATLQETGKLASKQTIAKSVAKTAFTAGVIDVGTFGITATHSYYLYKVGKLSSSEYHQHLAKRSSATVGSITGSTTGALVGSLILPGVGTFVGCVVGGMVGDILGSKVGVAMYDVMNPEDTVSAV